LLLFFVCITKIQNNKVIHLIIFWKCRCDMKTKWHTKAKIDNKLVSYSCYTVSFSKKKRDILFNIDFFCKNVSIQISNFEIQKVLQVCINQFFFIFRYHYEIRCTIKCFTVRNQNAFWFFYLFFNFLMLAISQIVLGVANESSQMIRSNMYVMEMYG
jgi:hypothetical protein